jgi:hypothetical protein
MPSILDPTTRARLMGRFDAITPATAPRWGRMSAPQMVAHLCDQMRHTIGDAPVAAHRTPLRLPIIKHLVLYLLPWPKGRVKGPREAFLTAPAEWSADLATLAGLVERFVGDSSRTSWPDHALFGSMNRSAWGSFCHKHFDHHLRQFGA